jgi:4'-phosphopantetheinyl transferase EntD
VIADTLVAGAVAAEVVGDAPDASLLPEEEAVLGAVAPARRRDFTLGRVCARRALRELGVAAGPILSGTTREPLWPNGVVGSITHCAGYAAAAVARSDELASLGIDAEPHAELPDGVLALVAVEEELDWLRGRAAGGRCWDRILFSAKESVYKAWFPLTHAWLGFHDAAVTFDGAGTFRARVLVDAPVEGFTGRYAVANGLVVTAAWYE